MDQDLLAEIIAGATPDENPADPLHMCLTVTTMEFALDVQWDEFPRSYGSPYMPSARRAAESFTERLRVVGKILCPIFTIVKPKEYVEQMTQVRRQYRGIAIDPDIQGEFADRVRRLLEEGLFRSIEQAIDTNMPARLSREGIKY